MNNYIKKEYIEQELSVLELWINQNSYIKDNLISYNKNNEENLKACDCLLTLKNFNKPLKVEIKMEEEIANKTGNFTLDAISVFYKKDNIKQYERNYKYKDFLEKVIDQNKYFLKGSLYTSDSDIVLKKIRNDDKVYAYSNKKLQNKKFIKYVEDNCSLKINPKSKYNLKDTWESAFYIINRYDKKFIECEVHNLEDI